MSRTIHQAGPVQDGVQRCSRCGIVLHDMLPVAVGDAYWHIVTTSRDMYPRVVLRQAYDEPPNCEVRDG